MGSINAAELLQGLNEASAEGRNPKLNKNGQYAFEVMQTKLIKGYNSGITFVIEFRLIESSNREDFPIGRECSITINRLQDPKAENRALALGNLKQFLAAAYSDKDWGPEYGGRTFYSPDSQQDWVQLGVLCCDNPEQVQGCRVRVQIDETMTKGNNSFAKPTFRAFEQSASRAA